MGDCKCPSALFLRILNLSLCISFFFTIFVVRAIRVLMGLLSSSEQQLAMPIIRSLEHAVKLLRSWGDLDRPDGVHT